jgi:hypothetical protein
MQGGHGTVANRGRLAELLHLGMRLGRRRAPREDHVGRLPAVYVDHAWTVREGLTQAGGNSRVQKQRGHLHVDRAQAHPGKRRGVGIKD